MKTKKETPIDSTSVKELEKLGFERITNIGHPYEKLSCGYRSREHGCIHLFPTFEESGNNRLYFDYSGGRLEIKTAEQLKKITEALKH